ncbi:crossover junction endodeoxyribonuclease RuvC [Paracraurococcus ruber]|uniref:Crossover junction endodeoxyribonuclease RuvC n=1 Tax=Paracraurococcus ruber TaxID=77675 RepID=A0ABS1D5B8_9PROT|nr:crossover junction endodeoxyribonuclease RuvC [Paracraurococcus ruber]MBK1661671.1 crossover junction endodeoxyribonuclease RuvC [Paracraurococcus ruber]TDG22520.1 crossover junction endodeoxyribonuclease RuvC [Paracraurococcus ruber]
MPGEGRGVNRTGTQSVRLLGLDPGLQHTGWGLVESAGSRLRHLGDGVISTAADAPLADRLCTLHRALMMLIDQLRPDEAAVEHTYVNKNPGAALKLGQARGVVLLAPALAGLPVAEYQAMEVKRAVVGTGHAEKPQVEAMVRRLLPGATIKRADAADALAVAICHAHHRGTRLAFAKGYVPA